MLWAVQRAFTGEPDEKNAATRDIGFREICTVAPLLGLSLFLGFYPKPVLDRLDKSVAALVHQVDTHSDHKAPAVNVAAKSCTTDADGRLTVPILDLQSEIATARGTFTYGPCDTTKPVQ
jgi:NADH-quinone oxidoreductase subunit M